MGNKLYLVRHGESLGNMWKPAFNDDKRNFLTPTGVTQATLAGQYFRERDVQFAALYSSNLTRARQTMMTILYQIGWKQHWNNIDQLNEVYETPTPEQVASVTAGFTEVRQALNNGNVLCVSHFCTMQVIFDIIDPTRKGIASRNGRYVPNAGIFVWDPDYPTCVDLLDVYDRRDVKTTAIYVPGGVD